MYIEQCVSLLFFILGGSWKISSELVIPREWVGSPEFESHLGKLLRDGCACGAQVKFGIRNVHRVQLTNIYIGTV